MLVLEDFVHMVPDVVPHKYVIVCVKLVDCRVTDRVCAVPSVPLDAVSVLFLGIVVRVLDAEAAIVPLLTPVV